MSEIESSIEPSPRPKEASFVYDMLADALTTKDKSKLRTSLEAMQRLVHEGSQLPMPPINDYEIEDYLKAGNIKIYVGSGTRGQRIILQGNRLSMPMGSEQRRKYDERYYRNFASLFGLSPDGELEVNF